MASCVLLLLLSRQAPHLPATARAYSLQLMHECRRGHPALLLGNVPLTVDQVRLGPGAVRCVQRDHERVQVRRVRQHQMQGRHRVPQRHLQRNQRRVHTRTSPVLCARRPRTGAQAHASPNTAHARPRLWRGSRRSTPGVELGVRVGDNRCSVMIDTHARPCHRAHQLMVAALLQSLISCTRAHARVHVHVQG